MKIRDLKNKINSIDPDKIPHNEEIAFPSSKVESKKEAFFNLRRKLDSVSENNLDIEIDPVVESTVAIDFMKYYNTKTTTDGFSFKKKE